MKQKLDNIIYGYDPSEYLPVYYNGKLDKRSFVAYKATRAFLRFSDAFDRFREASNR